MLRFILTRLLQAIPVLFVIASLTFFMVRLAPGGPFTEEKTIPKFNKTCPLAFWLIEHIKKEIDTLHERHAQPHQSNHTGAIRAHDVTSSEHMILRKVLQLSTRTLHSPKPRLLCRLRARVIVCPL